MKKRSKPLSNVKKIIIRLPNFLGDSIMSTPAIKLLAAHYPSAKITLVCKDSIQDLFTTLPAVEKVIIDTTKNGRSRLLKTLHFIYLIRKEKYDLGILFHNGFASAFIFGLCRIKHIVGYNNEFRKPFLDFHFNLDRNQHYINRYASLVNQYFNNKYLKLPELEVWHSREDIDFVFEEQLPVVGLSLGNDTQGSRAYPKIRSENLIQLLLHSKKYNLVFIGDENDALRNNQYIFKLSADDQTRVYNYSGKTSVTTHLNLIKKCDAIITIDSSAMHIAAALRVPFIVLQGRSTSPFCTVRPKVQFGRYLKCENGLINDDLFISQIKPETIYQELEVMTPSFNDSQIIEFN